MFNNIFVCIFPALDGCVSLACVNGGSCVKKLDGTNVCECPYGYRGASCEIDVNVCEFGVCKNQAKCVDGPGGNYTCECLPGFVGASCELLADPCSAPVSPCLNNGACLNTGLGLYQCRCAEQFAGKNCETRSGTYSKCTAHCYNNGSCSLSPLTSEPECTCGAEFVGARCELSLRVLCENRRCFNGGSCSYNATSRGVECSCRFGYIGASCEIKNLCKSATSTLRCQNNGTCVVGPDNRELCECLPDFSGDSCEMALKSSSSNKSLGRWTFYLFFVTLSCSSFCFG